MMAVNQTNAVILLSERNLTFGLNIKRSLSQLFQYEDGRNCVKFRVKNFRGKMLLVIQIQK